MTVNLNKGDKIELRKSNGEAMRNIIIGLGWDPLPPPKKSGFLSFFSKETKQSEVDCDASALLCKDGKVSGNRDIISYCNLMNENGSVKHSGDNESGEGEGDDETITVALDKVPEAYDGIIVVVSIYQAKSRRQHFGMIQNAFVRIVDADDDQEICRFDLSENYKGVTGMLFGKLSRNGNEWVFDAMGEGLEEEDITTLALRFQ